MKKFLSLSGIFILEAVLQSTTNYRVNQMGIPGRTLDVDKHEMLAPSSPRDISFLLVPNLNDIVTRVQDNMDIIHLSNTLRKHHFHTVT